LLLSLFQKKKNISRSPLFLTPTFAPALPSSSTPLVSRDPSPSISTKIEPKKLKRGSSNAVRLIETHRFQTPSIDPLFDLVRPSRPLFLFAFLSLSNFTMADEDFPIDINYAKIADWLVRLLFFFQQK
jgi:hypothetical protein